MLWTKKLIRLSQFKYKFSLNADAVSEKKKAEPPKKFPDTSFASSLSYILETGKLEVMALTEINRTINWIDQEIRDQQTGTPNQLAGKLSMSVRMLYFYLDMMRALGADITYCKTRMTFAYAKTGHFINGTKWVED